MSFDRTAIVTISIIALILIGSGYLVWSNSKEVARNEALAPDSFERLATLTGLTDLSGNPVSIAEYEGSVIVINSWASWCPFCVTELPDLARLAEENPETPILAINRGESLVQIEAYLNTVGDLPGLKLLADPEDGYYDFIGGIAMPETIFYDTAGNVAVHKRGFMKLEEMRTHLETARNVGSSQ